MNISFYYNDLYDINNFYFFTSQYFLLKNNLCFNLNFFLLTPYFFEQYNDNLYLLKENNYLNYHYLKDDVFYRITKNDNVFWSKGYNWIREDISLEYFFDNVIQNGKPRFFNKGNVSEVTYTSYNNYWMLYSLYINNYYNIEEPFSISLRSRGNINFQDYIDPLKNILGISNELNSLKILPTSGFYKKEFNYYYVNYIANILYDYKRAYGENSNFEFLYTSSFKRFFNNGNFFFNFYIMDSSIAEYMLKTYKEFDKQIKNYLFYEIKPFEFGFNALKIYGYFLNDNLKLENGVKFELYNNILFDLVYETIIPSKYNYQSIIYQNLFSNKSYFFEKEEFFLHIPEYKHIIYGLNRYYPSLNGKIISSDYIYPKINLPDLNNYKKKIEFDLYNVCEFKTYFNNYKFVKPSKYYLLDLSFFKKIISNLDYTRNYNLLCNNLSYMDCQLTYSITCSDDLTQSCYEQLKEDSMAEVYNDPGYGGKEKLYSIIDKETIEDYDEFLIPEGWTVFQYTGLPYEEIKREKYYIPVKSYLFINVQELSLRMLSDVFFEAEEIFGSWEDGHCVDDLVFEEYIVNSSFLQYDVNNYYKKLEDFFITNYITLDENFIEFDYEDEFTYSLFANAEMLSDRFEGDDEMLGYALEMMELNDKEIKLISNCLETDADSMSETKQSNDYLLEFYFG